jgi:hypothetical protein
MWNKYLIIACIALLVIAVGTILVGFSFWGSPQGTNIQNLDSSNGAVIDNQSSVSINRDGGEVPQKLPDIEAAYANLFRQILATEPSFTPTDSTSAATKDIYALYTSQIAQVKKEYPNTSSYAIEIALIDLTGDGTNEAIVSLSLPGYCGTGGCPLDILRKSGTKWNIVSSFLSNGPVGISNSLNNGFLDLYISEQSDTGYVGQVLRYGWSGATYEPKKIMAYWNGTKFVLR